jgi:hypothetical protein
MAIGRNGPIHHASLGQFRRKIEARHPVAQVKIDQSHIGQL